MQTPSGDPVKSNKIWKRSETNTKFGIGHVAKYVSKTCNKLPNLIKTVKQSTNLKKSERVLKIKCTYLDT